MSDIVQRLWDSDQASALTNEAAREIEHRDFEIERLRALLREAWMLTGGDRSPAYLKEFHDRVDAQAYELGLRLPR